MKSVKLSRIGQKKWAASHPWLTADDLMGRDHLPKRPGLFYFEKHWWMISPASFIRLRRFGSIKKNWMQNSAFNFIGNSDQFRSYFGQWVEEHFANLIQLKIETLKLDPEENPCFRWIFSENDGIPGLIVDVFHTHLVCQINSAPVETFWYVLREGLRKTYLAHFQCEPNIIELRNNSVRQKEGLEVIAIESKVADAGLVLRWNGFRWKMHPGSSQKTGAYFDQRENHKIALKWARTNQTRNAWDLCCYEGGFTLHLAAAGIQVIALDQSEVALAALKENLSLNNIPGDRVEICRHNIFEWFGTLPSHQKADLIVLDPPSLTQSRGDIAAATKALISLNAKALGHLSPGGILMTCVCSHHIRRADFEEVLKSAAIQSETEIQYLEKTGPSPDHAPLEKFPEANYLQCVVLKKIK